MPNLLKITLLDYQLCHNNCQFFQKLYFVKNCRVLFLKYWNISVSNPSVWISSAFYISNDILLTNDAFLPPTWCHTPSRTLYLLLSFSLTLSLWEQQLLPLAAKTFFELLIKPSKHHSQCFLFLLTKSAFKIIFICKEVLGSKATLSHCLVGLNQVKNELNVASHLF